MTKIVEKPWGTTKAHDADATARVHTLCIKPGGYCSVHLHRRKNNMFFVTSGVLDVTFYDERGNPHVKTLTGEMGSRMLTIPAGVYHSFLAHNEVDLIEIYNPIPGCVVDADDIERLSESGCYKESTPEVRARHHQSKILSWPPKHEKKPRSS
jgi:mannose-6-phosphate isomerase-like protein (cupin superfamily)